MNIHTYKTNIWENDMQAIVEKIDNYFINNGFEDIDKNKRLDLGILDLGIMEEIKIYINEDNEYTIYNYGKMLYYSSRSKKIYTID
jgi:hypothetical protein